MMDLRPRENEEERESNGQWKSDGERASCMYGVLSGEVMAQVENLHMAWTFVHQVKMNCERH